MNSNMINLKENIFFAGVITLIFDNIPKFLQVTILSSGEASKLSWYFFFAMFVIFIWNLVQKNISLDRTDIKYIKFIILLSLFLFISNIAGLVIYPYYNELLNGPVDQIEKLPRVLNFLHSIGLTISKKTGTIFWISARAVKSCLFSVLYTFGFSFVIFKSFKNTWESMFSLIQKAVLISIILIEIYSIVELCYLAGNPTAAWLLTVVNPFLHTIAADHNWWPPLLWKGQLRSVFSEPSRMGNYAAFALPFLWEWILSRKKQWKRITAITMFYSFLIFMTRARTAVAMYWGVLGVLLLVIIYLKSRCLLKKTVPILCITVLSLFASVGFNNAFMSRPDESVSAFMESNLGSLATPDKRSNGARYALIRSNLKTGREHFVFGVGNVLGSAYTVHNFNESDLNNKEVAMWVKDYEQQGVLKYGLDAMNEYVSRFAQNGITGLLLFLLPAFYGAVKLLQQIKAEPIPDRKMKEITSLLALIGTSVAGCNGSLTLLYTYWVVLALVYAVIYKGDSSMKDKA